MPVFLISALVIAVAGTRMTNLADVIADRTGLGEALIGGVLLGIATSLSGTVTSITAALDGQASLAVSNAVGGIAVQTVFLALADLTYRRANLEHAAASVTNLVQAALLILMLSLPLLAAVTSAVAVLGVHPITPVLVAVYIGGLKLADSVREHPMWVPRQTRELRTDTPEDRSFEGPGAPGLVVRFTLLLALLAFAGWLVARSGLAIAGATGLSQSFVGALMTAVATSLPELVTTLAAVRRGALTLAVGGIIGGNTFDVLFLVASDVSYRPGSVFHAIGQAELFLIAWAIAMTATLLMGLLQRQRQGVGGIGFESVALLALYLAGIGVQAWGI
ncbi:sodium:calcium antiporter [Rhodovibrio salinarum]|nr:sodium:calcium antiporter [Rhodovibrio salinarum]